MPKIQLSYSDDHTIDVESEEKLEEVVLSGEKTNGEPQTIKITNDLPFTFNGETLDFLRGGTINLLISLGGETMKLIGQTVKWNTSSVSFSSTGTDLSIERYYAALPNYTIESLFNEIAGNSMIKEAGGGRVICVLTPLLRGETHFFYSHTMGFYNPFYAKELIYYADFDSNANVTTCYDNYGYDAPLDVNGYAINSSSDTLYAGICATFYM